MGASKERDVKKKVRVGRKRVREKNKGRLKWRNGGAGKASGGWVKRDTEKPGTESAFVGRGGKNSETGKCERREGGRGR